MTLRKQAVDVLFNVRQHITNNLPVGNSFLPLDILLAVLRESSKNELLTVKRLFASLPHSHTGLRYHFDKLLVEGWLELEAVDCDKRIKIVKPTVKLTTQFDLMSQSLLSTFNSSN